MKISERYNKMAASRANFIQTAEKCSAFTLPYVFPEGKSDAQSSGGYTQLQTQYSSAGAEAVNFLANRLITLLFPPNKPFFRLRIPTEMIKAQNGEPTNVDAALSEMEKIATEKFMATVEREHLLQAAINLIIGGNVCFMRQANGSRYYTLHQYVCKRAVSNGKMLQTIIKENLDVGSLPKEYLKFVPESKLQMYENNQPYELYLYTDIKWSAFNNVYTVTQYLEDNVVLENTYEEGELPYQVLTWTHITGEDYGHSYCEDYLGSITSEATLSEAATQLSLVISRIINLVDPTSELAFNLDELTTAPSGAFLVGKATDVTQMVTNKLSDLQAVLANQATHRETVRRVFLQNSAIQRDAERVTAEEIRYMAQELETSQGGIYSKLASNWQAPLAKLCLFDTLEALGSNGKELASKLDIKILTGIESLSRTLETESTLLFLQQTSVLNNVPPEVKQELSLPRVVKRLAAGSDMTNPSDLLKTDEEKQAEAQQAQAMMATQAMAGMQ